MSSRRRWWAIYAVCAAILTIALTWISFTVLKLEKNEYVARAAAQRQESVRLALWRMDSWVAPLLAAENARPYFEYQSHYPPQPIYQPSPKKSIDPNTPIESPLRKFRSPYLKLHFQIGPDGVITSPQMPDGVPERTFRYFASAAEAGEASALLRQLGPALSGRLSPAPEGKDTRLERQRDQKEDAALGEVTEAEPLAQGQAVPQEEKLKSEQEFEKRKGSVLNQMQTLSATAPQPAADAPAAASKQPTTDDDEEIRGGRSDEVAVDDDADTIELDAMEGVASESEPPAQSVGLAAAIDVGSMYALWIGEAAELVFCRDVFIDGRHYIQGVVCNWQRMHADMLAEVGDLLPGASIEPVRGAGGDSGMMLASLPARLVDNHARAVVVPLVTPTRAAIVATWLAVLIALGAVAVTLRSSIAFGERRSRFASAVTHELRTPLTSFRMYTEMLADGMVDDPNKARGYVDTLKKESARLATLVENVLSYARLEEGRRPVATVRLTARELSQRVDETLARRGADAGVNVITDWSAAGDAAVVTDADAVAQILFNLVDNACKYGRDGGAIEVSAAASDRKLSIGVRDHGAGIEPADAEVIFSPFNRGSNGHSDKPGIGLGLALSRGLARDLGGDLELVPNGGGGAHFVLSLPLAASPTGQD